jgi:hypothetical protein
MRWGEERVQEEEESGESEGLGLGDRECGAATNENQNSSSVVDEDVRQPDTSTDGLHSEEAEGDEGTPAIC